MITIVDYDTGNLKSIENALHKLGANYNISASPQEIALAEKIILPGVGAASHAMYNLKKRELIEIIQQATQPILGICIGMQILCQYSEESNTECLGIFPNIVKKLIANNVNKVPHVGWNKIENLQPSPLMNELSEGEYFYYVHSFAPEVNEYTIAQSTHNNTFSAAIAHNNFFGCQFHPEKSGIAGEKMLTNFLKI